MKEIRLGGKYSKYAMLVDDDIYEKMVACGTWYAKFISDGNAIYARRPKIYAHRLAAVFYGILKSLRDPLEIDHMNHNGLDNTRKNLRAVTHEENQRNRPKQRWGTSKFKGVFWNRREKYWTAQITISGHTIRLGSFKNEIDAAIAYDIEARKFGYLEFALNFPHCN
jgi:hypothetical protein